MSQLNVIKFVRAVTSSLPRIKGLGVVLALVANYFRRSGFEDVEVKVFGKKMLLNPSDLISNSLIFTPRYYDRKERALIRKLIRSGDYVVDIGANVGAYTLMFADIVGENGLITAIEAEENNARRLQYNIKLNDVVNVVVRHRGVSDRCEVLPLLLNSTGNAGGHSFCEQGDSDNPPVQQVKCEPLVALLEKNRTPNFMKLDIEGFEYRVLSKYFEDVAESRWPQFFMLEDSSGLGHGDAVALTLSKGYHIINRFDWNVFLSR